MLSAIAENRIIESLAGTFARSPQQLNSLQETDAEIVQLTEGCTLAITTDSIVEEIALGLYADPYLIGWMTVMVNLSDLAAVGAQPVGLVVSEVLPHSCSEDFLARLQEGIRDACQACGTFVLGGDTNHSDRLILTGTAIGTCPGGKLMSRIGSRPGDLIFATNQVGRGNAFALVALSRSLGTSSITHSGARIMANFRPLARLKEGQALRGVATSCMDTSDGVIATLDQMMRLNRVGFELDENWSAFLDPLSRQVAHEAGIPEWLLLAGQHGEFELLFTVPPARVDELMSRVGQDHVHLISLGRVISERSIRLRVGGRIVELDTAHIRNCAIEINDDAQQYFQELLGIDKQIRKGVMHHAAH